MLNTLLPNFAETINMVEDLPLFLRILHFLFSCFVDCRRLANIEATDKTMEHNNKPLTETQNMEVQTEERPASAPPTLSREYQRESFVANLPTGIRGDYSYAAAAAAATGASPTDSNNDSMEDDGVLFMEPDENTPTADKMHKQGKVEIQH